MARTVRLCMPVGEPNCPTGELAIRPTSLKRLRISLLDNGKEFSDRVLEGVAETLRLSHGLLNLQFWRKGYPAKLAPFIDEMAAETDVAISGVGH